ncbi:TPA: IS66 family transposase zinc-finger binding domain-containing protein [Pluralibacter gergoviae]|uniref:IS66 family transposase zinc-finger binding domain-containing protein n=1 Tax=Pluralibacter gergoviae TaxID=61647 RepID=UPI000907DF78|nr:IS66 family transposase zinc-finger binding domain-containing protein [Pluralibacter gergoviae]EKV0931225.1 IS66 family transposase zinc-finger binding domain-containing protein [Pluralibacter gergoviae]EKV6246900.1 IS66 family transposase zinc-finger binding domain-containing protein [Pluralibacter gergoviae]EKZ9513677.1 IS66 family transposase zinc-finger binding domain-containing protein [Pluralibacter gergoviae]ELC3015773.1 IS66 family transposase zinc-finger binding domain-containing pr
MDCPYKTGASDADDHRQPLPEHLPRITQSRDPVSVDCCPYCRGELMFIRNEIRERLVFTAGRFAVEQYVQPLYRCQKCLRLVEGKISANTDH